MHAVISTTADDRYLFLIPISTFSWNQIGVSCLVFVPESILENPKFNLVKSYCREDTQFLPFKCHPDAEATYAQVARLFAAALPGLPQDEVLLTSDADMMVFGEYFKKSTGLIDLFGADLVSGNEFPMCYCSCSVHQWWYFMMIGNHTYQQCLDLAFEGEIINRDTRGNLWFKDQSILYRMINKSGLEVCIHPRANKGGFAKNRVDRDDSAGWVNAIDGAHDFHMFRPGADPDNFSKIMRVIRWRFEASYDWMNTFHHEYRKL